MRRCASAPSRPMLQRAAQMAAAAVISLGLVACSATESAMRQDPLTVSPPAKPNWALAAPAGVATTVPPTQESRAYPASVEALLAAWDRVAAAEPRTERTDDGLDPAARTYVQRSAWLRFPDIIDLRAIELGEGQTAPAVYSRSIYGYSDLGVNAARVVRWLDALDRQMSAPEPPTEDSSN